MDVATKQLQFNAAMEKYTAKPVYKYVSFGVSVANVLLQSYLLYRILPQNLGIIGQLGSFFLACLLTDFINGLVHMYMDNNDRYDSLDGPLIANFHLHHKVPQYKKHNLLVVYFMESGSKVWLVGYLLLIVFIQSRYELIPMIGYTLVYIGILSSVAEVSHYLCHSSTSKVCEFLSRIGLLLPKRHHARHHLQDNCSYAFLNGISDPLLNLIAATLCKGYKQNSDMHYASYTGVNSEQR